MPAESELRTSTPVQAKRKPGAGETDARFNLNRNEPSATADDSLRLLIRRKLENPSRPMLGKRGNRSRESEGDRPIFTDKRRFDVLSRPWKLFVFRRENASVPDP